MGDDWGACTSMNLIVPTSDSFLHCRAAVPNCIINHSTAFYKDYGGIMWRKIILPWNHHLIIRSRTRLFCRRRLVAAGSFRAWHTRPKFKFPVLLRTRKCAMRTSKFALYTVKTVVWFPQNGCVENTHLRFTNSVWNWSHGDVRGFHMLKREYHTHRCF